MYDLEASAPRTHRFKTARGIIMKILQQGFHAHKYQALGNDYLVIDPAEFQMSFSASAISALCDRNRGVGSDGILYGPILSQTSSVICSPFGLRIFNPDGSEAEKSGNGLRIFSLYLYERGFVGKEPFEVQTKGGMVECRILATNSPCSGEDGYRKDDHREEGYEEEHYVEVSMGEARFLPGSSTLAIDGIEFRTIRVSMGNPHCVLLGQYPTEELARRIGPLVENHPDFPNRTNVQFLEVIDRQTIRIEIWERGAGYTLASGSSSCAAAAAARRLGLVENEVRVRMAGGTLYIDMREPNIKMTGPAERSFDLVFSPSLMHLAMKDKGD